MVVVRETVRRSTHDVPLAGHRGGGGVLAGAAEKQGFNEGSLA
jgi:hypothetical protein